MTAPGEFLPEGKPNLFDRAAHDGRDRKKRAEDDGDFHCGLVARSSRLVGMTRSRSGLFMPQVLMRTTPNPAFSQSLRRVFLVKKRMCGYSGSKWRSHLK